MKHNNNRPRYSGPSLTSNGPDVRLRGSASQICEKYEDLALDSRDAMMAELYWQCAEHWGRVANG